MFFLSILSLFCAVLSSAEIYCYDDPAIVLPTLASCYRAFGELRMWVGACGASPRNFSPAPASPSNIPLPQRFIDPQRNDSVKCGINISWAPRPWVPPPVPLSVDRFSPFEILWDAGTIMRMCFYPYGPSHKPYSIRLGYTWVKPHQWVVIQFVAVFFDEGNAGDLGSGNENVTVVMDNETNTTVDASTFNPSTCGSPITLPNDSRNATEAVVAA